MMKLIYADASSVILLEKSGLFDTCLTNYRFVLSASVYDEISKSDYPDAHRFIKKYHAKRFEVAEPAAIEKQDLQAVSGIFRLDRGERDTILLYQNNQKGFILLDDGPAARFCFKNSIPFINALLVPKILYLAGRINKIHYLRQTDELCRLGRYSDKITALARAFTLKDLERFLPE